MNFCSGCGQPVHLRTPEGDERPRYVCDSCHMIHYQNPRVIVGCIAEQDGKVLLCKRANEPRAGYWTLPAGFLEIQETAEEGAARETDEEAHAAVEIRRLFSLYSIPHIGQVYLFFLATLKNADWRPGRETLATGLFARDEVPWDELAFSSVEFTLKEYFRNPARADVLVSSFEGAGDPLGER